MEIDSFKNIITKEDGYNKFYFYFLSVSSIVGGLYFFVDLIANPTKYEAKHSYGAVLLASLFLISLGLYSLFAIRKRYEISTIDNNSLIDVKKKTVQKLLYQLGISNFSSDGYFYSFKYQRHWWTYDYMVYLNIDEEKFSLSVIGITHYRGGFIDFGSSIRLRKKITSMIKSIIDE